MLSLRYFAGVRLNSFDSVENIVREVGGGVSVRGLHLVGSQAILLLIYLHIIRSLFYRRGANIFMSLQGAVILLITIGTAFLGYVLPWRQISFWGATVITRFLGVLPYRPDILEWVWGGYTVDHPTLTRFFSLHYILRISIAPLSLLHIVLLHEDGSGTPLGDRSDIYLPFWPYFRVKDIWPALLVLTLMMVLILFLGPETENLKPANPMVTPTHIKPEWYFLMYYAILRAVPSKVRGLVLILLSIIAIVVVLTAGKKLGTPTRTILFSLFLAVCLVLGILGGKPVEEPFLTSSLLRALAYFILASFIYLV